LFNGGLLIAVTMIKSTTMFWVWHVARMGKETRNVSKVLVEKTEPLGKRR
jgi:hypothetical protein